MKTRLKHAVRALFVAGLLLGLFIAWLLTTAPGLRLLVKLAESASGQALVVESVQGALNSGARLENLAIKSAAGQVRIGRLALHCDCTLAALGIVQLKELRADDVNIELSGAGSGSGGGAAWPRWPVVLLVDEFAMNRVSILAPGQRAPLQITRFSAGLLVRHGQLRLNDLLLAGPDLQVRYNGRVALRAPFHIDSRAGFDAIVKDRLPVYGRAHLVGDARRLTVNLTLEGPLPARLHGDLDDPFGSLRWSVNVRAPWSDLRSLSPDLPASLKSRLVLKGTGRGAAGHLAGSLSMRQPAPSGSGHNALNMNLDAELHGGADGNALAATFNWRPFTWKLASHVLGSPGGSIRISGPLSGMRLRGGGKFVLDGGEPADLSVDALATPARIDLHELVMARGQARLHGSGDVQFGGDSPSADFLLHWQGWSADLPRLGRVVLSSGTGALHGRPDAWTLAAKGDVAGDRIPDASFDIHGFGHDAALTLDSWQMLALHGSLDGSGRLNLSGSPEISLEFRGQDLDPGVKWPDWPGRLAAAGSVQSRPGGLLEWQAAVDGTLRKRPLKVGLALLTTPERADFRQLEISSGNARVSVHGSLADRLNLSWLIDAPELNEVHPRLHGRLVGEGRIQGTRGAPELQVRLSAEGVRSPWIDLDRLHLRGDLDLASGQTLDATLEAAGLRHGRTGPVDLEARLRGSAADNQFHLQASAGKSRLEVSAAGSLVSQTWRGSLQSATLETPEKLRWTLEKPASALISRKQVELDHFCLTGNPGHWCALGAWSPPSGNWSAAAEADALPLAWLQSQLPASMRLDGSASLDARADGQGDSLRAGQATLSVQNAAMQFDTGDRKPYELPIRAGKADLQLQNDQAQTSLHLDFADASVKPLDAQMLVTGIHNWPANPASVQLAGSVAGGASDLSFLSAVFPYASNIRGGVGADMKISGTVARPRLAGGFTVHDAAFDLPDLGTHIEDVNIKGSSVGPDLYQVHGGLRGGDGKIAIDGQMNLDDLTQSRIRITGQDFQMVNLPEIWALASPDLNVTWSRDGAAIAGRLLIPKASINLDEAVVTAPVSGDVVVVGGAKKPSGNTASPLPATDVQLQLGDDIEVSGRGVSGKLHGSLHLTAARGAHVLADGEISISNGKYSAYGQSLDIKEGRLVYRNAEIDNPNLSVRAVRSVEDIQAGLSVTGYLTRPTVTLFSTPAMSQEQILSYIVFGRPLSNLTSGNGSDLVAAATSLGLQNSGMLTHSIASTFGLDKLQVQTGQTAQSASLIIGKYLSPRLYLSYGIGLFENLSSAKLRYDLTRHWAVEAERNGEFGFDLLYKIEK